HLMCALLSGGISETPGVRASGYGMWTAAQQPYASQDEQGGDLVALRSRVPTTRKPAGKGGPA
ncbi:MAG TPA: hypothetical protein VHR15_16450, partial [Ktedonobacterales bacterium]|nr:hypothetical protein [Ktedonobacterales bacterium]